MVGQINVQNVYGKQNIRLLEDCLVKTNFEQVLYFSRTIYTAPVLFIKGLIMTLQELLKLLEKGYIEVMNDKESAGVMAGLRSLMEDMDISIDKEKATYIFSLDALNDLL